MLNIISLVKLSLHYEQNMLRLFILIPIAGEIGKRSQAT